MLLFKINSGKEILSIMANNSFSRSDGSIPLQTVGADVTGRDVGSLEGLWEGTNERLVVGRDDGIATVGSADG